MIKAFMTINEGSERIIQVLGLQAEDNSYITDAVVKANLIDPYDAEVEGDLHDITLPAVDEEGNYQYVIPSDVTIPTDLGYKVKISISLDDELKQTIFLDVIVPTSIDLTTVIAVKSWLGVDVDNIDDDDNIQSCITALSLEFLHRTGVSLDNVNNKSPFVEPIHYNEYYNGNGNQILFLRNTPIISINQLVINGVGIGQTDQFHKSLGYTIDASKKYLVLIASTFTRGVQNIYVDYQAGYTKTPMDINIAIRKWVALNYKRRSWIDQKSQALPQGAGTVTYQDYELSPDIQSVIDYYSRLSSLWG